MRNGLVVIKTNTFERKGHIDEKWSYCLQQLLSQDTSSEIITTIQFPFTVHFIFIKPVLRDHLS
jgi:hypothetical protein